MAAVSESIVREFFELQGFLVRQQRKFMVRTQREDEEVDFQVSNPQPVTKPGPLPLLLSADDLCGISRAVVVVKGWHSEIFRPSTITLKEEDLFRFVDPQVFHQAALAFGGEGSIAKILVLPSLPHAEDARRISLDMCKARGVDAVLLFSTMLAELIARTESHRNYHKSDLLQTIRILKNYDFLREPQMELFKTVRRKPKPAKPAAE